jgi:hypothetical protein
MKYISLVVVIVLMAWTWSMANSKRDYGLAESREMESQIEAIVTDYIQQNRPTVKDLRFHQLFTEVVRPNEEIRVHLRYSVDDATTSGDTVQQTFKGIVILKSKDGKNWEMVGQDVKSPLVEFKEGSRISAKEEAAEAEDESQVTPTASPTPEAH